MSAVWLWRAVISFPALVTIFVLFGLLVLLLVCHKHPPEFLDILGESTANVKLNFGL